MTAEALSLDLFGRGLRLRADDDGRLIVSPGELLTDDDRVAIRRHKGELLSIVYYAATPSVTLEPGRIHDVPSTCLGPRACAVLGVCGRLACLTATEHETFAVATGNARTARNPHRVTRLVEPQDISITSLEREDDRAA